MLEITYKNIFACFVVNESHNALHLNFLFLLYGPGGWWWVSAESAGYVDKRGWPHDAAQEHAKPLNTPSLQPYCEYFGSESIPEGISQHKVYLGGGSKTHQEDWHKVSPEKKGVMSDWVKKMTATRMKKSQGIRTFSYVLLSLFIEFTWWHCLENSLLETTILLIIWWLFWKCNCSCISDQVFPLMGWGMHRSWWTAREKGKAARWCLGTC